MELVLCIEKCKKNLDIFFVFGSLFSGALIFS